MQLMVNKTLSLSGTAGLPGSKSQSIRGMFFALLAKGESTLFNVLDADDTQTAMRLCQTFGAEVAFKNGALTLTSRGVPAALTANEIHTDSSGLCTRFVLPLLGLRENFLDPILVSCSQQMQSRPIKSLLDALRVLGMQIQSIEQEEQLPVLVSGKLLGGKVEVDGTTSQYLSALLISLPCAPNDSEITVNNLHERPYVEMTLAWLKQQGIRFEHQQNNGSDIFSIPGGQGYQPFQSTIAGDFSSASCLLAAAALFPGEVELQHLDMNDAQGDKQLIHLLQKMGADIVVDEKKLKIKGGKPLQGIAIDANSIPDLLPALAVIATKAAGKTFIFNVEQARLKETDRIHSMTEGLTRMGATIEEHADGMTIYPSALQGAIVNGYGDHRTVMALSIAGLLAEGNTMITDGEAVTKTFPNYVQTMQSIGARIAYAGEHIILMGFKHVGKTLIGKQLAVVLNKNLIDLDNEIEKHYEEQHANRLTCRQIMQVHGESFYRTLEQVVLEKILQLPASVIALGGGTLMNAGNQEQIKSHCLLHIIAPRGIVFERIMVSGRPAFFDPDADPYETFSRLWEERGAIYKKLASCTIDNNASIDHAVKQAKTYLESRMTNHG